ncbi:hypothetical protein [Paraburkholderia nemoris]|uniref:hypothetical protein n=1 Tax=Paraburkholderia nemoris TaxID=2793076 RepID=UPI0038B825D4
MALRVRKVPQKVTARLSPTAFIDVSLRNHLSLTALCTEHGAAFHLGTIVRTMFASIFLFDAGFGEADPSIYTKADRSLAKLATSRSLKSHYRLDPHEAEHAARLLAVYDLQLQTAPLEALVAAHQLAESNFHASSEERLSIPEIVQRSAFQTNILALNAAV